MNNNNTKKLRNLTFKSGGLYFIFYFCGSDFVHSTPRICASGSDASRVTLSTSQGFLSKHVPFFQSDASQSSMSAYDKFITPNSNRAKHALSYQKNAAEHDPFTIVDDKEEDRRNTKVGKIGTIRG